MPNTKISALTAGNPAQGTDEIPIARGAANFKVTAASIAALSPAGTVTSVGLSGGTTGLTTSGSPVTSSGTITIAGTLAPANGGTGAIATPSNGQILIGNGTNYSVANLTAGSNITITNSAGGITIAASGGGGGVTTFSAGTTGFSPSTATSGAVTLTGTLALANGGTGQTTKAAAFNALSPVTSTGDLIIGNGTNSNTRLPLGFFGQYLQSNGTTATWANLSVSAGDISGTVQVYQGGTGSSTNPSNGQLLIGNLGDYQVANLTAGTGITITNGAGSITIAAGGGGGPTINVLSVLTSSGSFNNSPPSSSVSKPLIGYNVTGFNYGAFYFRNNASGFFVTTTPTISSVSGLDSTGTSFSYTSGVDFNSFPSTFSVYDAVVTCYGLNITNATMQTLFSDSKAAITSPSLAPLDATSGFASANPWVGVAGAGFGYTNQNGLRGVTVSKTGPNYLLEFGTNDFTPASVTVGALDITINSGGTSSYFSGADFTQFSASNSSNGMFALVMSVSNATLQTLLDNSFL
jgi:hypothetical protein